MEIISPIIEGISPSWQKWVWIFVVLFLGCFFSLKNAGKGRDRFLKLIKNQSLQSFYIDSLKSVLTFFSTKVFKDFDQIEEIINIQRASKKKFFSCNGTLSHSSFNLLLILALLYPIVFFVLNWLFFGGAGSVGGLEVLPDHLSAFKRIGFVVGICTGAVSLRGYLQNRARDIKLLFVFAISIAISIELAGTFLAGTFAGALSIAIVIAITQYFALALACTFALAIIGTFAGALADTFADNLPLYLSLTLTLTLTLVVHLVRPIAVAFQQVFIIKRYLHSWLLFYSFCLTTSFLTIYLLGCNKGFANDQLSLLLMFGLLPLINAPFDWLSLSITRSLLIDISNRNVGGGKAFLWSIADILIALFLMIGVISATVLSIAAANFVFQLGGHHEFIINLNQLFSDLELNSFDSRYIWVYMLFLSTLLPTVIHLIVAAWAVVLWLPNSFFTWLSRGWKEDQSKHDLPKLVIASFYFSLFIPFALLIPFILLGFLHIVFFDLGYAAIVGDTFLHGMRWLAALIDPSVKAL